MNVIMQQAMYYGFVMLFTIFAMAMFMKGFFMPYIKVRTSFGRLVLVKIRNIMRDYYAVGWIEEGFLFFKRHKEIVQIPINANNNFLYKSLSITMIDVDEEKNAIAQTDYTSVSGFDHKKFSDLLVRALQRPTIDSGKEKLLLFLIIIAIVLIFATAYLSYQNYTIAQWLKLNLPAMINNLAQKATVVAQAGTI